MGEKTRMAYAAPASRSSRIAVIVSTLPVASRARPVRSRVNPTPHRIHTAGASTRA
jgi:hypothetical protein